MMAFGLLVAASPREKSQHQPWARLKLNSAPQAFNSESCQVLGRMGSDEFAALTTSKEFSSREAATCQIREAQGVSDPPLALSVGVAHFDPQEPAAIDELLEQAKRDMNQPASQLGLNLPLSQFGLSALSAYRV